MSISVIWDNEEKTALRFQRSQWEWTQFHEAFQEARAMLDTVEHGVDVIVDLTNAKLGASNLLSHTRTLAELQQHPAVGTVIVVGADTFAQALYHSANAGRPKAELFQFAQTLDQAYEMLGGVSRSEEPDTNHTWDYWEFVLSVQSNTEQP
jgi:hypothetical protein